MKDSYKEESIDSLEQDESLVEKKSNITSSNIVNLTNFDPFNKQQRLNSPCSLEVCRNNGINLSALYRKSYESIKSKVLTHNRIY